MYSLFSNQILIFFLCVLFSFFFMHLYAYQRKLGRTEEEIAGLKFIAFSFISWGISSFMQVLLATNVSQITEGSNNQDTTNYYFIFCILSIVNSFFFLLATLNINIKDPKRFGSKILEIVDLTKALWGGVGLIIITVLLIPVKLNWVIKLPDFISCLFVLFFLCLKAYLALKERSFNMSYFVFLCFALLFVTEIRDFLYVFSGIDFIKYPIFDNLRIISFIMLVVVYYSILYSFEKKELIDEVTEQPEDAVLPVIHKITFEKNENNKLVMSLYKDEIPAQIFLPIIKKPTYHLLLAFYGKKHNQKICVKNDGIFKNGLFDIWYQDKRRIQDLLKLDDQILVSVKTQDGHLNIKLDNCNIDFKGFVTNSCSKEDFIKLIEYFNHEMLKFLPENIQKELNETRLN
jgi:hypothetical protein